VDNYFSYFSEIEEHYLRRRGGGLLLSTLDWTLIETWKEAGVPLEAVLRGIDSAFDKYEQRPSKTQKVNSLAYCAQAVLTAAEDMKEAAVGVAGSATGEDAGKPASARARQGFEPSVVSAFLRRNAELLDGANLPQTISVSPMTIARETSFALHKLAEDLDRTKALPRLEDLERHLTVLEEKLFAALLAATPDEQILAVRTEADRDLAPFQRKMPSAQIDQLQKQYIHKRLLEKYGLPRLSLFYM
jgi:hypothetical protein